MPQRPTAATERPRRRWRIALAGTALMLGVVATAVAMTSASADSHYQRGPAPTAASISAPTGPFATASVSVARQSNFGGGVIYYPTDTSQGTFGAIAISPGLNGTWPGVAWLGPRLASQGFVVFGIDTLALNDNPASRATQLLAALDYLTQTSSVSTRVDAGRLGVAGHSLGGGGALEAALRRPSLWAAIPNAPFFQGSASNLRVPTLITAMQNDSLVGQNRNTYNAIPATTEKAYVELAGAGHNQIGQPTTALARTWIPWLKIFLDQDTRYHQFLCPTTDMSGLSQYQNSCPLISTSPTTTNTTTRPPTGGASTFSLVGVGSGKCVDVPGASQTNGTGLIIYTCNGGSNQRWTQTAASDLRIYNNSRCMEAGGANSRAAINSCSGSNSQKWTFNSNGTISNVQSGLCLDVSNASTANNAAVIVWSCHTGSNQRWTRQP
jgi:dienelactone hydrolase